jgi:hypothetical protein
VQVKFQLRPVRGLEVDLKVLLYKALYGKAAKELIVEAEQTADENGIPVQQVLRDLLKEGVKNPLVEQAYFLLKNNQPRYVAYSNIFERDFLLFLKEIEKKGMPALAFKEFAPILDEIEEANSKIKKGFLGPTVSYFFMVGLGFFGLSRFKPILQSIPQLKDTLSLSSYLFYLKLSLLVPVFMFLFFFVPPFNRINPTYRLFRQQSDLIKVLTIFKIAIDISMSPSELYRTLVRLFPEFQSLKAKLGGKIPTIADLAMHLKRFLAPVERVILSQAASRTAQEIERVIIRLRKRKMEFFKFSLKSKIDQMLQLYRLAAVIPLLIFLTFYLKFMLAMSRLTTMMNQ